MGGPFIAEDDIGGTSIGRLSVSAMNSSAESVDAMIVLDGPLNGLPGGAPIVDTPTCVSTALRSIKVETESEDGVAPLSGADFRGRPMSIETSLLEAGIEVTRRGRPDRIPANPRGWDIAALHRLMQDFAQELCAPRALDADH
ncbi:hypothetical protein OM076_41525 [Solirubrobacter ginsenosidimutans]|uniref:Uncharacterized protein n=1 Tax=Solirubrobacter ginsenosidimutans TaxID=490573 RepID=A0A9X3S4L5_9ACTN|nr:hypothetical protein [Solirubrobacter ginsenosidimutans]MDA0166815.1 hypothetical protein [Solirubrobacter ginsenosidimutans]